MSWDGEPSDRFDPERYEDQAAMLRSAAMSPIIMAHMPEQGIELLRGAARCERMARDLRALAEMVDAP